MIESGYHGQIDSMAILPAVLGVVAWRLDRGHRAIVAGALIGVGGAIKVVPLFTLLALMPTVRSRREAGLLIASAAVPPLVSVAPFLIAHPHGTWSSLTENKGIPGWAGLSLFHQPALIKAWLGVAHQPVALSAFGRWMFKHQNLMVAIPALATGAYAYRRRLDPVNAAALIWLVVTIVNPDGAFNYFVWAMPFLLLAGCAIETALLQVAFVLPACQFYFGAARSLMWSYVPLLMAAWVGMIALAIRQGRTVRFAVASRAPDRLGAQPR